MTSARDEVLLWSLVDWLGLERVHRYVSVERSGEPLPAIQRRTLELIQSMVSDGLLELGELDDDCRFVAWTRPLDESMQHISEAYLKKFDEVDRWWFVCWIKPTEKGLQAARAIRTK